MIKATATAETTAITIGRRVRAQGQAGPESCGFVSGYCNVLATQGRSRRPGYAQCHASRRSTGPIPDPAGFGVRLLAWLDQRAAEPHTQLVERVAGGLEYGIHESTLNRPAVRRPGHLEPNYWSLVRRRMRPHGLKIASRNAMVSAVGDTIGG
jgi:hypothetical protein